MELNCTYGHIVEEEKTAHLYAMEFILSLTSHMTTSISICGICGM